MNSPAMLLARASDINIRRRTKPKLKNFFGSALNSRRNDQVRINLDMKITPFGAAGGEVTGSAYLVQTDRASLMVDCGLFQGGKQAELKNTTPGGALAGKLNATLLTHGHLDHTGRLPLLSKAGFTGPVYATQATIEMTGLILRDSARLQLQDAEYHNRKLARTGAVL